MVEGATHRSNNSGRKLRTKARPLDPSVGDKGSLDPLHLQQRQRETLCGTCGGSYSADEFWIACDVCERWFHGKCVKITPAKAESIKQYKCPSCSSKKGRQ
ncbi:hypothetical protein C4D60_Mb07t13910 [Musa balbisiana]|uniref:PHD finger protein ALFIN-LIKE n=1 Tax=Musa balbisiana TaxID=52838 RepID=A0A4S8JFS4_MUSBA|nr:hypothetical protein C4D60_Mb07t13910 [Musa balbisiana]